MGEFIDRTNRLLRQVGDGDLLGRVVVDQRYAAVQHEHLEYRHPRGGQAKYLEQPLYSQHQEYMRALAKDAITEEGSGLVSAMIDNMEDLAGQVRKLAPVEFADLRRSAHPTVVDGGQTVYDRPPMVHRLTERELRIKSRLRSSRVPGRLRRAERERG